MQIQTVSSAHCMAKGVRAAAGRTRVEYLSPYAWNRRICRRRRSPHRPPSCLHRVRPFLLYLFGGYPLHLPAPQHSSSAFLVAWSQPATLTYIIMSYIYGGNNDSNKQFLFLLHGLGVCATVRPCLQVCEETFRVRGGVVERKHMGDNEGHRLTDITAGLGLVVV